MYRRIDHLAVLVNNLEEGIKTYKDLGFECTGTGSFPELGFRAAFFPIGESHIHLIEPTDTSNPAAKYLKEHGEGFYAVAIAVDDPEQCATALKRSEVRVVGTPERGMFFIHPKSADGLLIQLLDKNNRAREESIASNPPGQ